VQDCGIPAVLLPGGKPLLKEIEGIKKKIV